MRVAVVDDQRLAVALGDLDVGPEGLLLGGDALGPGAEEVQAGLADPRTWSRAASASISASASSSAALPPGSRAPWRAVPSGSPWTMRGASLGCSATEAWTARWAAAVSAAQREPATSQPTWTTAVTLTAAARARDSSTVASCMSRWVWESATGTLRGSGSGGASVRLMPTIVRGPHPRTTVGRGATSVRPPRRDTPRHPRRKDRAPRWRPGVSGGGRGAAGPTASSGGPGRRRRTPPGSSRRPPPRAASAACAGAPAPRRPAPPA